MAEQVCLLINYPNMQLEKRQYEVILHKKFQAEKIESGEVSVCMKTSMLYKKSANEILQECGQNDTTPVDITEILEHYGISAKPMDFSQLNKKYKEKILGALICFEDDAAIFYSEDETMSPHRIRFTVAHELAHVCITGKENHVEFRREGQNDDPIEMAANIFAGEILIPEKKLKDVLNELILPSVNALSEIFDVSRQVVEERLLYLGLRNTVLD